LRDDADLARRTVEALRRYREALVNVEELEQREAAAHQTVIGILGDLERAIFEDSAPSDRQNLFESASAAVARSSELRDTLSEATTTLDVARQTLAALEQQLGYIPAP
jgi:DNA repair ATPase RecN